MNRLERLIMEIKKQLFPYHQEHDIERGRERWAIEESDYLTSWVVGQLDTCRKKSKCAEKGMCVFYSYSDLARKNFEICRELILAFENGEAACKFTEKKGGE